MRLHLENIKHLLDDPRRTSAGASTDEHDNAPDEEQEEDFDGGLTPAKVEVLCSLVAAHSRSF